MSVASQYLERREESGRTLLLLLQSRLQNLLFAWFYDTLATVRREAKGSAMLRTYAQQLHCVAQHNTFFHEESSARAHLRLEEKREAVEYVMLVKFWLAQASYVAERNTLYQKILLMPLAVARAETMLQRHAEFRDTAVAEEHQERYQLQLRLRVYAREAKDATQRGDVERAEARAREDLIGDWNMEWIARYREFRLEDSMFQLERFLLAQGAIRQAEDAARAQLRRAQLQEYCELTLLSRGALDWWATSHSLYVTDVLGPQIVRTLFQTVTDAQLLTLTLRESHDRLFLFVEESNTFHREEAVLLNALREFRECCAAAKIQRWSKRIVARLCMKSRQAACNRLIETRIGKEHTEFRAVVRAAQETATYTVIAPFVLTRLSYQVRHNLRRQVFATGIRRFTEAYLTRKDLFDVWDEDRREAARRRYVAAVHLATLMQRIGRAFLVREEVCDYYGEVQQKIQLALQHRHVAALKIQWMYRQWKLRRFHVERRRQMEALRVQSNAAVKIQALARRMFTRQFYTLLLLPRHRTRKALFLQRVLRGAMARRALRRQHLVNLVQCFVSAFRSRRLCVERRLSPIARKIQCAFRVHIARTRVAKARLRRQTKELDRAKTGYAVMIQAAYRGYAWRRRDREAAKLALQVRLVMLENDATNLEDDLWRIGRGFIARRRLFFLMRKRRQSIQMIQSYLRAVASQQQRLVREEFFIEALCHNITVKHLALVQGCLMQRSSTRLVQMKKAARERRDTAVAQFQQLLSRCRRGYNERLLMFDVYRQRVQAASVISMLTSGYLCRKALASRWVHHCRLAEEAKRTRSADRIARSFRAYCNRKRAAAIVIQRSLVRAHWPNLLRKAELRRERAKLYALHKASLARSEASCRRDVADDEAHSRHVLELALRTPAWLAAVEAFQLSLPRVAVPPSLELRIQRRRLSCEEEAVLGFHSLRHQMLTEAATIHQRQSERKRLAEQASLRRDEEALRSRLQCAQLECRRTISLAFLRQIERMFAKKLAMVERAEADDRCFLLQTWENDANGGLTKAKHAMLLVLDRMRIQQDSEPARPPSPDPANPSPPSAAQGTATDAAAVQPHRRPQAGPDPRSPQRQHEKPLPKASVSHSDRLLLQAPLRSFTTAMDHEDPCEVNDDDLTEIFGDAAVSSSSSPSLPTATTVPSHIPPPRDVSATSRLRALPEKRLEPKSQQRPSGFSARMPATSSGRFSDDADTPVRPGSTGGGSSHAVAGLATAKPRVLPPLAESTGKAADSLSILQPRPQPSASSRRMDAYLLIEKAKDDIAFTAEGIIDSSRLGADLNDETICVVEGILRSRIVTGLVLPHSTLSVKAFLHLLRVARASKAPLAVVDVSHSVQMEDVAANHLVDLVDQIPALRDVRVHGTSVSAGKRLLLFHALERKAAQTRAASGDVKAMSYAGRSRSTGATVEDGIVSLLPPVRFARPLQLPRRNGWSTEFKQYDVPVNQARADEIFATLMDKKPPGEIDW